MLYPSALNRFVGRPCCKEFNPVFKPILCEDEYNRVKMILSNSRLSCCFPELGSKRIAIDHIVIAVRPNQQGCVTSQGKASPKFTRHGCNQFASTATGAQPDDFIASPLPNPAGAKPLEECVDECRIDASALLALVHANYAGSTHSTCHRPIPLLRPRPPTSHPESIAVRFALVKSGPLSKDIARPQSLQCLGFPDDAK